ncbi:MAG: anti-sigma factor domain-containing protein [Cyanobacteriota bacterium]
MSEFTFKENEMGHGQANEDQDLAGYLLGDLLPEEARALEERLQQDSRLAAELHAFQEALNLLPYGLPGVIPPAGLRDQVLAEVGLAKSPLPFQSALPALPASQFKAWWRWLASLMAVALVLLGLDNWRLRQALQLAQLESVQELANLLQQPGSRLVNLQGEAGVANLLFQVGEWQNLVLAATDLPQLASGESYHLWLKLDNGDILYCGDFQVDAYGSALVAMRPPRTPPSGTRVQKLWITAQVPTSPREPRGEPVLIGAV